MAAPNIVSVSSILATQVGPNDYSYNNFSHITFRQLEDQYN